jgi:hypothetical protein
MLNITAVGVQTKRGLLRNNKSPDICAVPLVSQFPTEAFMALTAMDASFNGGERHLQAICIRRE